jgi:hypothetical protein
MSRQDPKFYNGTHHIFYSDDVDTNVYLKAADGQTLVIEGVTNAFTGTDTQIAYNKEDAMVGNANLTFDETYLSALGGIKTTTMNGVVQTDDLDYNEIYRGTNPQDIVSTQTTHARALGTDVTMAKNVNYVAYACPYYVASASKGCMSIWNESSPSTFSEYTSSILTFSNFTLDATVKFCSVNENADLAVLTDGSEIGVLTTFTRSGATWSVIGNTNNFSAGKLSGTRLFYYDYNSNFSTRTYSGGIWTYEQSILPLGFGLFYGLDYPIAIDNTRLAFCVGNFTYLYSLSGTWILSATITSFTSISMDYYNNLLVLMSATTMRIYESGILTATFTVSGAKRVCTNGTYVFANDTTGNIFIYSKVVGVWTKSVNSYLLTGSNKMSANANFLSVGLPTVGTYGSAKIFEIVTYVNTGSIVNVINLLDTGNKVSVIASGGLEINDDTNILAKLTVQDEITVGSGTVGFPAINFAGSTSSGMYSSGLNTVDFATNGISRLKIASNGLLTTAGSHTLDSSGSVLRNYGTTESTSTITGATIFTGGLGVAKTIFCNNISTPLSAFKYCFRYKTTTQYINAGITGTVEYDILGSNSIVGLSYSAGVFTTSIGGKFLITTSVYMASGGYMSVYGRVGINGTAGVWHGIAGSQSISNSGISSSCILSLGPNDTFAYYVGPSVNTTLGVNATYGQSNMYIYCLN